jgi:signal transduction histidine kinase
VNEFLEERFQRSRVRLQVAIQSALPRILADADLLQEVFLNIALNAADSMPKGGALRITAESVLRCRAEEPDEVRPYLAVTFEDSGCGIQPEHLDRVFDPFFTTKDVGEGTGLGLSVSYGIVQEHGGWIDIDSERGRGTRVTVYLARDPAAAGRRSAELGAA